MSVMHLISTIGAFQTAAVVVAESDRNVIHECPEQAVVFAWDAKTKTFDWYMHPSTPVQALCGMLEMVKSMLVSSAVAQRMAAQNVILGPDGRPMRH